MLHCEEVAGRHSGLSCHWSVGLLEGRTRVENFGVAVIFFPACSGGRKSVGVAIGKGRRILVLLIISLLLRDFDHYMLSLLLLCFLRTPALILLGVVERNGPEHHLLLLLESPHLVLALAVLAALGMRLLVDLFPALSDLLANEFLDEGESGVLERVRLDESFDLVLDIVHIIDIAEPDLVGLALPADVYLHDQLLPPSFALGWGLEVLGASVRGVHPV